MSYDVHDRERGEVTSLGGPERFEYFLKKVADWEEVWSLSDGEGWALCSDDTGQQLVPLWPAEAFAKACCCGEWSGYEPRAISLEEWLEEWTPGMECDGRKVALLPTQSDTGVVIEPANLASEIREAMAEYE